VVTAAVTAQDYVDVEDALPDSPLDQVLTFKLLPEGTGDGEYEYSEGERILITIGEHEFEQIFLAGNDLADVLARLADEIEEVDGFAAEVNGTSIVVTIAEPEDDGVTESSVAVIAQGDPV